MSFEINDKVIYIDPGSKEEYSAVVIGTTHIPIKPKFRKDFTNNDYEKIKEHQKKYPKYHNLGVGKTVIQFTDEGPRGQEIVIGPHNIKKMEKKGGKRSTRKASKKTRKASRKGRSRSRKH